MDKNKPKILLVNPPIYDFAAYDFWLKPYGLMAVAGWLRKNCNLFLFDYLDRLFSAHSGHFDCWGRGHFHKERIPKPHQFRQIPRYYYRFGRERADFGRFLQENAPFDAALIQTVMTYWYPGVREVIEDIRRLCPTAKVIVGGFYATCCPNHAAKLGADVVVRGDDLSPMFAALGIAASDEASLPPWELYPTLKTGVMTLTRGCPFRCGYCFVPQSGVSFAVRPIEKCLDELAYLIRLGATDIAFYDDALLYQADKALLPFLDAVMRRGLKTNFHTPNGLHARFLTADVAKLMVQAGFGTFYLGYESNAAAFHGASGGKVAADELAAAADNLRRAEADMRHVAAYEMLGHPRFAAQQLEASMRFANRLGLRVMLSDFSPLPGTPDGELCSDIVDLSEPLNHNKTAFPIWSLGIETVNYYKDLCRSLNRQIQETMG